MLDLLVRRPDFRRYWLADAVSLIGDWLSYVAIAVLVVEGEGTWVELSTVLILHTLPASLGSPLAGWLTDRMDARRLMILSAALRGLLTLAMTIAARDGSLFWVQAGLFARMAVGATEHTAGRAVLKRAVASDELGLANAIGGATWSVLFALGVALGGLVTSQVGAVHALLLDAATFFLSAALLMRLSPMPPEASSDATRTRGLGEAVALAQRTPVLRALVFGKLPVALATGGTWVYLNHVAGHLPELRDTALAIGLLQSARAIGTGLGPFLQRRYDGGAHHGLGPALAVWTGFAAVVVFHMTTSLGALLFSALAWGMSAGANWVNTTTGLLAESPTGMEGRLSSLDVVMQSSGLCIGSLAGAAVGQYFDSTAWLVYLPLVLGVLSWLATQGPLLSSSTRPAVSDGE